MIADTETVAANECSGRRENPGKPLTLVKHFEFALALLLAAAIAGTSCGHPSSWNSKFHTLKRKGWCDDFGIRHSKFTILHSQLPNSRS